MKREYGIENFFANYSFLFNRSLNAPEAWVGETAAAFSECFIAVSPPGVQCGKNDEAFHRAIPQGYAFYRKIGIKSMTINSMRFTEIDPNHSMVKVQWMAVREKENSQDSVTFDVCYFVRTVNQEHKIFGYITGDEQALFQAKGWI